MEFFDWNRLIGGAFLREECAPRWRAWKVCYVLRKESSVQWLKCERQVLKDRYGVREEGLWNLNKINFFFLIQKESFKLLKHHALESFEFEFRVYVYSMMLNGVSPEITVLIWIPNNLSIPKPQFLHL